MPAHRNHQKRFHANIVALILCMITSALQASTSTDLTELSLEDLMNIEVTTVSKKEQRLIETAAAVFVLTREDVIRSGARTLPDALRLVPGLFVGRIDANKWAISSRGFTGLFANKLLVLIDGRSVYTPLFSGVFWEAIDVPITDIERIEVIRGSGGALWGANAVNGIINIITQSAANTQGGHIQAGWGSKEPGFAELRYSGQFNSQTYARFFGKGFRRSKSQPARSTMPLNDDWKIARFGGRLDAQSLTLIGNFFTGSAAQTATLTTSTAAPFEERISASTDLVGGSILARWHRQLSTRSDVALQAYYDQNERNGIIFSSTIRNIDIDFQHRFQPGNAHEIVWGMGYRLTDDAFDGSFTLSLAPDSRKTHLFNSFIQNDFRLIPNHLRFSIGSKFEHNSYTGFELQPNIRLWLSPYKEHAFWAAAARSVRTPSRAESDLMATRVTLPADSLFTGSPVALGRFSGNPTFLSESVHSLDLGYRTNIQNRFWIDIVAFYNTYQNLRTNEPNAAAFEVVTDPLHLVIPITIENNAQGKTYGLELTTDWQMSSSWRLKTTYSYLEMDVQVDEDSADMLTDASEGEAPAHQANLWLQINLSKYSTTDLIVRYVDQLPAQNLDSYTTLDVRLSWQANPALGFALVAQNLVNSPRIEYSAESSGITPSQIGRLIYGAVDLRF